MKISKRLRDLDRTDGRKHDHYSAADVRAACHVDDGGTMNSAAPDTDVDDDTRRLPIQPKPGGDPGGVAVWLSADDLAEMGVDPDDTDAVAVTIDGGDLRVRPAEASDSGA